MDKRAGRHMGKLTDGIAGGWMENWMECLLPIVHSIKQICSTTTDYLVGNLTSRAGGQTDLQAARVDQRSWQVD